MNPAGAASAVVAAGLPAGVAAVKEPPPIIRKANPVDTGTPADGIE